MALRQTSLYGIHKDLGATLVDFAGYEMPLQYDTILKEHLTVRNSVGIFDVSHMGVIRIKGADATTYLNFLLTRDLNRVNVGSASYSLLCNENGFAIDDLIVYHTEENTWTIIANASNKENVFKHLQAHTKDFQVELTPPQDNLSLLALQGPRVPELLKKAGFDQPWPKPFHYTKATLFTIPVEIAFTGYTGELGCEILCENEKAPHLWEKLLETEKVKPCGLGSRDTLRTEMGYSLYGHEISSEINPVEAGLSWVIHWNKENFIGKAALEKMKAEQKRKIIALLGKSARAPRPKMSVVDGSNEVVGFITSGTFSPSLTKGIGLALVDADSKEPYSVQFKNKNVEFTLTTLPFYKKEAAHG